MIRNGSKAAVCGDDLGAATAQAITPQQEGKYLYKVARMTTARALNAARIVWG
ncbi:hypothetical protein [Vibrio furnissii]|uniref:hypothetical protein n=1 Tax=Vibrio furnissii TaxID=29494 RepID=UPI001EEC6D89|nr:hypothetical protein [Vibrio furnissii]